MSYISRCQWNLIKRVRRLWMEHSEWTKMAFTSIIFRNPDEEAVIERLLRNPKDFAGLFRNFYGKRIACKFEDLLTEHLTLAGDLVLATMAGDTGKAERINKRLYENAEEIATLLSSINPYWAFKDWEMMLFSHLDLAKKIASEMVNGKYEESISTYDKFEAEVMLMANRMAEGILKQFN